MIEKTKSKCGLSPAVRIALCGAIGTSLSGSNSPAIGIAVAVGLYLALAPDGRRC
jgi:hypothetical protein